MASKVDMLLTSYENVINEKWDATISGKEKIWFLVYEPNEHRKVGLRIDDFEVITKAAGKKWGSISV